MVKKLGMSSCHGCVKSEQLLVAGLGVKRLNKQVRRRLNFGLVELGKD